MVRLTLASLASRLLPHRELVPAVALTGRIGPSPRDLNLQTTEPLLKRVFAFPGGDTVALLVNSPGGSATQSFLIASRIRGLAKQSGKKVVAFVEDAAASGGYFLACAADEIVATPFSVVGSIGVVVAGYGFQDVMKEVGVERRVYTSGTRKMQLDPFAPTKQEDVDKIQSVLTDLHGDFIKFVKEARGSRITAPDEIVFSGDFWTAPKALELGLIDSVSDPRSWLEKRKGENVLMPVFRRSPFVMFS